MTQAPALLHPATLEQKISQHDNNFNVIRLLAACCVVYFHSFAVSAKPGYDAVSHLVAPWSNAGGLAVGIFFLISGVFVTQSFHRQKSWLDFLLKRTLRIWPGLVACLLVTATLACMSEPGVGVANFWRLPSYFDYLWKNATMRLEFFIDGVFASHPNRAINGSIHTLVLEVKMYGFVLAISFLGSRAGRAVIGAVGAIGLAVSLLRPSLLATWLDAPSYGAPPIALFFAGMGLFALAPFITWRRLVAGAALSFVPVMLLGHGELAFWILITGLVLGAGAFLPALLPASFTSDLSYGVFLYGFPIQQLIYRVYPEVPPYGLFGLAVLFAGSAAWLSWRWVEQPSIQLARRWAESLRRPRPTGWIREWINASRAQPVALVLALSLPLMWLGGHVTRRYDLLPTQAMGVSIKEIGPRSTKVCEGFNVQPDGSSAMWMILDRAAPPGAKVRIGNVVCDTILGDNLVVTCRVPDRLFAHPGRLPVVLELRLPHQILRSEPIEFRVGD